MDIHQYMSENDLFLKDVNLEFKPERPKSNENYNLVVRHPKMLERL